MSNKPLPPRVGDPPTKVIFEGVPAGSQEARNLLLRYQGEIRRFHAAARQSVEISGQPGHAAHRSLPDGGELRYANNYGQETITVRLRAQQKVVKTSREQQQKVDTFEPVLAVDVLFDNAIYMVGDVTSYTIEDVPGDPGEPADPFPPEDQWVELFAQDDPPFSPDDPLPEGSPLGPGDQPSTEPSHYYRASGVLDGMIGPYTVTPTGLSLLTSVDIDGDSVSETEFTLVYGAPYFDASSAPSGTHVVVPFGWTVPGASMGTEPTPGYQKSVYVRDTYEMYDILNVVGLRIEATEGEQMHEAISTGGQVGDRVVRLSGGSASVSVSRELTIEDPDPRAVGEGFLIRARGPSVSGTPSEDVVIDVYVASVNLSKENAYPDAEGATFEADDPSFEYGLHDSAAWTIRVREFTSGPPASVRVDTFTETRTQHFTAPDGGGGPGPDPGGGEEGGGEEGGGGGDDIVQGPEPTIPGPLEVEPGDRTSSWAFAATSSWVDNPVNEPASPTPIEENSMGHLLTSASGTTTVAGPDPLGREIPTAVEWGAGIAGMTKIATIVWTPPERAEEHGTAQIIPA